MTFYLLAVGQLLAPLISLIVAFSLKLMKIWKYGRASKQYNETPPSMFSTILYQKKSRMANLPIFELASLAITLAC